MKKKCRTCLATVPYRPEKTKPLLELIFHLRSLPHTPPTLYCVEWGPPEWAWGYLLDPSKWSSDGDAIGDKMEVVKLDSRPRTAPLAEADGWDYLVIRRKD